jgi:small subunit ribosomal protein S16
MLKIRLKRSGRKKRPFYKIVIMKNLSKRDGKSISDIGFYDPLKKIVTFNNELLYKFINSGAYPTATIRHLIYKTFLSK